MSSSGLTPTGGEEPQYDEINNQRTITTPNNDNNNERANTSSTITNNNIPAQLPIQQQTAATTIDDTCAQHTNSTLQSWPGYFEDDHEIASTDSEHWLVNQVTGDRIEYTAPCERDDEYLERARKDLGLPENPKWPNPYQPPYHQLPPPYLHYTAYGRSHPYYEMLPPPIPYWDGESMIEQERLHFISQHPRMQNEGGYSPHHRSHDPNNMTTADSYLNPNSSDNNLRTTTPPIFSPAMPANLTERVEEQCDNNKENMEASGPEPGGEAE